MASLAYFTIVYEELCALDVLTVYCRMGCKVVKLGSVEFL